MTCNTICQLGWDNLSPPTLQWGHTNFPPNLLPLFYGDTPNYPLAIASATVLFLSLQSLGGKSASLIWSMVAHIPPPYPKISMIWWWLQCHCHCLICRFVAPIIVWVAHLPLQLFKVGLQNALFFLMHQKFLDAIMINVQWEIAKASQNHGMAADIPRVTGGIAMSLPLPQTPVTPSLVGVPCI